MKKQSFIISEESGFFLPYVLFITALLFIVIMTSIRTYQQDIQITHHLVDQLRIETIVQMGLVKFKDEYLLHEAEMPDVNYVFPDGEVTIASNFINEFEYRLHFSVLTINGSEYTAVHTMKIEDH